MLFKPNTDKAAIEKQLREARGISPNTRRAARISRAGCLKVFFQTVAAMIQMRRPLFAVLVKAKPEPRPRQTIRRGPTLGF